MSCETDLLFRWPSLYCIRYTLIVPNGNKQIHNLYQCQNSNQCYEKDTLMDYVELHQQYIYVLRFKFLTRDKLTPTLSEISSLAALHFENKYFRIIIRIAA